TETVKLIVPAAAGGSTDVMGRLLAAHLQSVWGQSAIVENRSGAGGTIGTAEVVRSKADGHTILIGNPGPNAIALRIYKNLSYKAEQLQPVSNMIRIPNIVSAHPSTGIKSIPELIAFLKAVRGGGAPAVTGEEGVASLEIAIRCLELPAKPAASAPRNGPRRVVG
ncbi:tripartite tricarboxylate transporter substrate-binding protein, partial [Noviherbaspirillum sp. ST9]|uniref:tripartite tricarboxylate transporter substrate-binding protein n=1 Tax=Noviherbaspirillum sp. ST9 TaxID=3401606 RepID=UPI003B5886BB